MKALTLLLLLPALAIAQPPPPISKRTSGEPAPVSYPQNARQYLPVICTAGIGAGDDASKCTATKYDYPKPGDLVQHCPLSTAADRMCRPEEIYWQPYVVLDGSQRIRACATYLIPPVTDTSQCKDHDEVTKSQIPTADVFVGTPMTGPAPLTILLAWKVGSVNSCMASGSWTGAKGIEGQETLITSVDADYRMQCIAEAIETGSAQLSWKRPQQNSDGSPLLDLAGYVITYGTTPKSLLQRVQISDPMTASYIIKDLKPGTWYFSLRSYNSKNVESKISEIVSQQVSPAKGRVWNGRVQIDVTGTVAPPIAPTPPTDVEVSAATTR